MQLIAYLNFDGTAREAMDFYARALGGTVTERFTYGESPMAEQCGPDSADRVMHSQIEIGSVTLMGADGPPPHAAGSTTINIVTDTPEEADRIFAGLSEGGAKITMPIGETSWALRFGMLTDRYGAAWMVNCNRPQ